jgi:hypothetical protein
MLICFDFAAEDLSILERQINNSDKNLLAFRMRAVLLEGGQP